MQWNELKATLKIADVAKDEVENIRHVSFYVGMLLSCNKKVSVDQHIEGELNHYPWRCKKTTNVVVAIDVDRC
jgi:hypothetical protein